MFREIVCPISDERTDSRVVRIVAGQVALLALLFLATRWLVIPAFLLVDFAVRGFGTGRRSLLRAIAQAIVAGHGVPRPIDRAPKLFAARVGLVFALGILAAAPLAPGVSTGLAVVLVLFALLESLLDFCAGCIVYSYVVLPLYGVPRGAE